MPPATPPASVVIDGRPFLAALGPVTAGLSLGPAGAVATQGRAVMVTPAAGGTVPGQSDGLTAKRAADAACADGGGTLNPRAVGRFDGAAWIFDGACT